MTYAAQARLQLLGPKATPFMHLVDSYAQQMDDGGLTPEQALPLIRYANQQIEAALSQDCLHFVLLDMPKDDFRFRMSRFG